MDHDWPVIESAVEYETGWYTGGYDLVEQPDGSTKRYYWAELPPAVVVVPVLDSEVSCASDSANSAERRSADPASGLRGGETASNETGPEPSCSPRADGDAASTDEVVFVEQYRPAVGERMLELPAGIVEHVDGRESGDPGSLRGANPDAYAAAGARELREETGFEAASVSFLQSFWVSTGVLRHERGIVVAEGLTAGDRDLDGNEFLTVRRLPVSEALAAARSAPANDATVEGLLLAAADGYLAFP